MRFHEFSDTSLPQIVFHGTSDRMWATVGEDEPLYLTVDRQEAESYADRSVISDVYAVYGDDFLDSNGNEKPPPSKQIIVSFDLRKLMSLPEAKFEPDWGWVAGHGDDTVSWETSLKAVGSFCVDGLGEAVKALGTVEEP